MAPPSMGHERRSALLTLLMLDFFRDRGVSFEKVSTTVLRREELNRGVEGDDAYYLRNAPPPPEAEHWDATIHAPAGPDHRGGPDEPERRQGADLRGPRRGGNPATRRRRAATARPRRRRLRRRGRERPAAGPAGRGTGKARGDGEPSAAGRDRPVVAGGVEKGLNGRAALLAELFTPLLARLLPSCSPPRCGGGGGVAASPAPTPASSRGRRRRPRFRRRSCGFRPR